MVRTPFRVLIQPFKQLQRIYLTPINLLRRTRQVNVPRPLLVRGLKLPAGHHYLGRSSDMPRSHRGGKHRTASSSASQGLPHSALPNPHLQRMVIDYLNELNIGALRKEWMMLN